MATLGLCAAGWLALAPVAFGYRSAARPGAALNSGALNSGALNSGALNSGALNSGALHSGALNSGALDRATLTDWGTAAGLAAVSLITLVFWVVAWRRRLRADGILARTSWRQARWEARAQRRRERDGEAAASAPDPAQVLSELRALLIPLLAEPANGQAAPEQSEQDYDEPGYRVRSGMPAVPAARPGGLAAMESMLSGAELLMVGCGEEEAW